MLDDEGLCSTQCPAGHECDSGLAVPCASGKYAPPGRLPTHSYDCIPCAPGRFGNATQLTSCFACPAGRVSKLGDADCFPCSAGEFAAAGAETCASCPAGTYSLAGAGACTNCSAGRFASEVGTNVDCYACAAGSTAPREGMEACV